jgi:hypothetical protein
MVISIIFILPKNVLSQTFISKMQIDITPSGDKKSGYSSATLVLSKANGTLTVKFDNIKTTGTFIFHFWKSEDDGLRTLYYYELEDNDPDFAYLGIAEYKSSEKSGDYTYRYYFTLAKMNSNGSVDYATTFFANKE